MVLVPRQSLSDRVFDYLRARLAARQVKLGERINARQVTEELSVSRTTVNKALERLIKEGWVELTDTGRPIVVKFPPKGRTRHTPESFDFSNQTDTTYEIILEKILHGDIPPGQVIKERPLANQLGVNPATVRRASEWLSKDGLLVRLPRRGWRVSLLTSRDFKDIFKIRLLLEPLGLESAVHHITPETLDELIAEADKMIERGESAEVGERRKADHRFHKSWCQGSGSHILVETLDPLVRKVLLITTVGFRYGRVSQSFEEHKKILQALKKRDLQEATERLKAHLSSSLERNLETWERR
jgi:DNA-binding GntR family transcriptional regulator